MQRRNKPLADQILLGRKHRALNGAARRDGLRRGNHSGSARESVCRGVLQAAPHGSILLRRNALMRAAVEMARVPKRGFGMVPMATPDKSPMFTAEVLAPGGKSPAVKPKLIPGPHPNFSQCSSLYRRAPVFKAPPDPDNAAHFENIPGNRPEPAEPRDGWCSERNCKSQSCL